MKLWIVGLLGAAALAAAGGEWRWATEDDFLVAGITVRTANSQEMSGHGAIPHTWERWMKERFAEKIPHKLDSNTIALYSGYESDENGAYDYTLGVKVSSAEGMPDGITVKHVSRSRYAVFDSEQGTLSEIVVNTWKRIWATPQEGEYRRSYRGDFEVYGAKATNPANAQISIYVGVK